MPDFDLILALRPQAQALLETGTELAAITTLRAQGHDPEVVRASMEQAVLRNKLDQHWPSRWVLTRDGAEQASHPLVAQFRARVIAYALADSEISQIVDLGAGIGSDSYALASAGLHVIAIERDPQTATFLAHNLNQSPTATVLVGDSDQIAPTSPSYFVDPARRTGTRSSDGNRALPERDPERWFPPLSSVMTRAKNSIVFMKAAPAFDPPAGWARYCISVDRNLVEMFTTNAHPGVSAVMIDTREATTTVIEQSHDHVSPFAPTHEIGCHLYELDPAVTRAQLNSQIAHELSLQTVGTKGLWLTGDKLEHVPSYLRSYVVHRKFPIKDLAAEVRELPGIAIKNKDSHLDYKTLRASSAKPDDNFWAVIVTSIGGHDIGILVNREKVTA